MNKMKISKINHQIMETCGLEDNNKISPVVEQKLHFLHCWIGYFKQAVNTNTPSSAYSIKNLIEKEIHEILMNTKNETLINILNNYRDTIENTHKFRRSIDCYYEAARTLKIKLNKEGF